MIAMRKTRGRRRRMVKIPRAAQITVKPTYYKALWHNCNKCKIHFMSEFPHATAYLCDECFNSMPHYRTKVKKQQQVKKGPTYAWLDTDWPLSYIIAYIWGCSMCLLIIAYYLFEK